jgi:ferrous iron transport protein A
MSNSVPLSLATLSPGQRATICGFTQDDAVVQRLMQMGLLSGAEIRSVRQALGGDPIEYEVLGYYLSLRRSEAQTVLVEDVR